MREYSPSDSAIGVRLSGVISTEGWDIVITLKGAGNIQMYYRRECGTGGNAQNSPTIFAIFDPEEGSSSADTTSISILCCEVASVPSISVSSSLFFRNLLFSSSAMEVVSEEEFVRLEMLCENDWSAVEEGRTAINGLYALPSLVESNVIPLSIPLLSMRSGATPIPPPTSAAMLLWCCCCAISLCCCCCCSWRRSKCCCC